MLAVVSLYFSKTDETTENALLLEELSPELTALVN